LIRAASAQLWDFIVYLQPALKLRLVVSQCRPNYLSRTSSIASASGKLDSSTVFPLKGSDTSPHLTSRLLRTISAGNNSVDFNQQNCGAFWPFYRAMLRRAQYCHSKSESSQLVCPSVTLRYRDHIGRNSSKIISRLVSHWSLVFALC